MKAALVLLPCRLLFWWLLVVSRLVSAQEEEEPPQQQEEEPAPVLGSDSAATVEELEDVCTLELEESCARCGWGYDILNSPPTTNTTTTYDCSLPGLQDFAPGGQYEGIQANYLSYVTNISSPQFRIRALEFEACTGGRIVFSDAADVFTDPVEDLGTATRRGSEVYDGYFMGYSHFPEVSALDLVEPLNERIRRDNARLKWEDVLPKVKSMGEYRHRNGELNLEFLMFDADFFVPIVRLDLLEQHNFPLPNSWDELVEIVKYFNGTDLNGDGDPDDWGFCHFPKAGAGEWDWWFSEMVYATWATFDQTKGTQEGIFFDEDTMEPRFGSSDAFREAARIWKDLWKHGFTSESDIFLDGRCAVGFGPPGSWKRVFLTPHGVHRTDSNGTVIWQPKMKNGDYAEPYQFKPFGTTKVHDRATGQLVHCTPKLCPKAEQVPPQGHYSDDDRAKVLLPSPLAGQLMNRAPFFWSGGLGTLIRKSAPKVRKDLLWDFFVYANSPDTAVYDVANYRSWLDSWRYSQLSPGDNFIQAGWSQNAYQEHANIMRWALSKESNGAFNLRLPGLAKYTHEVVGQSMLKYIDDEISLDQLIAQIAKGWIEITEAEGKLDQLEIYRSSLGLAVHSQVDLCRLHRELMDEKDPSVCRKYDETDDSGLLLFILIPVAIVLVALLVFLHFERKRRNKIDLVWKIDPSELHFEDPPRVLGQGTFGFVLKAEYRGTEVAVKRFLPGGAAKITDASPDTKGDVEQHVGKLSVRPSPFDSVKRTYAIQGNAVAGGSAGKLSSRTSAFVMGQTMTAQASKAMVEHLKSGGENRNATTQKRNWKRRSSFFQTEQEKEYNKQKNDFVEEMKKLATLRHQCVITIMGAVLAKDDSMIVLEYMDHGSLYDLLHNETIILEGEIILPILRDIAQGIRFLHAATPQIIHCDLKSSNILVDGRFRAKVADFGLSTVASDRIGAAGTPYFLAPEILRGETGNTVESDAYAFGMVLFEVYSRKDPFEGERPLEVLRLVADKAVNKRPPTPPSMPVKAETLMAECLCNDPRRRPTFEELDLQLKRLDTSTMEPVGLESASKTEQARNDSLLEEMFPKHVADALRQGRKVEPHSGEHCTIFSSEICGFDSITSILSPLKVADLLHRLYSKFDDLCGVYDIYKVETINDAYMAITGLLKVQPDHAKRIAEFSIAAIKVANETPIDLDDPDKGSVNIQVGFSSGPVVANVVGSRNPRYCLFGDAVNTASRMEEYSEANRIHCSEISACLLEEQCPEIPIRPRGLITMAGKGEIFTFFVNEEMD